LVLIAQTLYFFRGWITQTMPTTRPAFVEACKHLRCSVPLARDDGAVTVVGHELIEQPGKPGRILLTAIVANRSGAKQDFPTLEIKLADTKEAVLASRILTPSEYLGRAPMAEEGINPSSELYINLSLDLATKLTASGYEVRVFYP
jgi:hypothetical protein